METRVYKVSFESGGRAAELELPLCKVERDLYIAGFNILGNTEVIRLAGFEMFQKIKNLKFDIILTSECKGIPLAQEVARLITEQNAAVMDYVVARKSLKLYMKNSLKAETKSITTEDVQTLYLSEEECAKLRGKTVLLLDDVISTGNSIESMRGLLSMLDADCAAEACIFAEGRAVDRPGIVYLKYLPLFDGKGREKII